MAAFADYHVADIKLADWGRKELDMAEVEMPGLMSTREEYAKAQPLKGARISGSLHMTIQTAVLIETLKGLGADIRWASCNIYSTQDHAAAAIAATGIPVFAFKGETLKEYWQYTAKIFDWGDGQTTNMILDDGGDATLYICWRQGRNGPEAHCVPQERRRGMPLCGDRQAPEASPGGSAKFALRSLAFPKKPPQAFTVFMNCRRRASFLPRHQRERQRHQVKFDNKYGGGESRVDAIRRGTDVMMAGKVAVVLGYGDVGKGSALSLRGAGARVVVTEVDPICALQAAMDGYSVQTLSDVVASADIFVTATGNKDVITVDDMKQMKDMAIVCNIGHFDNEIQVAELKNFQWSNIKPQVDLVRFPKGNRIVLLSQGRLVNLGNATGHPSFVMSASFTNQTLAQIELFTNAKTGKYKNEVYVLPKHLDEKVASLHLEKLGVKLTRLSDEQAAYIGVTPKGPFKPDYYRY